RKMKAALPMPAGSRSGSSQQMAMPKPQLIQLALSCLIGILFVLPHGVRFLCLQPLGGYSPFSARTPSMMVWDETFAYGAQVNYTYQHHRAAYDVDAFEHRDEPVPYSILPIETEVIFARLFHSVDAAQIFVQFLFPALTAWTLIFMFRRYSVSAWLAAFLALVVLVLSFSARTIYDGALAIFHSGLHSTFSDTLQAARNPHPNMTFPLFLAACLSLGGALYRGSKRYACLAGILGGLLFYSYVYYAIPWSGCIALVTLATLVMWRDRLRESVLSLVTTALVGLPFVLWTKAANKTHGYAYRSARLGMLHSHSVTLLAKELTVCWFSAVALCLLFWGLFRTRLNDIPDHARQLTDAAVLVCACVALSAIAAMNMQIVTGFNIQPEIHYPHMVIQPATIILIMLLFLVVTQRTRLRSSATLSAGLFIALFALCTAEQISGAINSAQGHRIFPAEAALFGWLNQNTSPDDVIATTDLSLCVVLPVFTHNYSLLANGSRTSGSDDEVLDRFLLANALTSTPESRVIEELDGPWPRTPSDQNPLNTSYAGFLYEWSPYRDMMKPSLSPLGIAKATARYRNLNLPDELLRYRVNYVYASRAKRPPAIPGWETHEVFQTGGAVLWRLEKAIN
ncbi:MAG TPA: hypothetical protein VGM27_03750, partial [Acidobacteriaceae bacterium]